MTSEASNDLETIRSAVLGIHDHWRNRRYDRIGEVLVDDVVIAPPGSDDRVRGRDAYVQSYRDYDAAATTLEFSAGEPRIDLVGDTAVALCPFEIAYDVGGTTHRERGHDLLVLSRRADGWKVVWRTMRTTPVGDEGSGTGAPDAPT